MLSNITDLFSLPIINTIPNPLGFLLSNGFINEVGNEKTFNVESRNNLKSNHIDTRFTINVVYSNQGNIGSLFSINEWKIAVVLYQNTPIMIIRNYLWYFRDGYSMKYIINTSAYKTMTWDIINNLKEDIIVDNSIYYFNPRQLFGDFINQFPQDIYQPEVYDMDACLLAINVNYPNE